MTVTTSYPGVYIQELPSLTHSVTPAPTSTAVFVGYTHPFLTTEPLSAVQLFSFSDYQTNFGGFFSSPWQPDFVGQAVFQFFLNGGSTCYVVGLPAQQYYSGGQPIDPEASVVAASVVLPPGVLAGEPSITFTAKQPVGVSASGSNPAAGIPMQVAISNLQQTTTPNDTADIVISYGTTVETYRKVLLSDLPTKTQASRLATVSLTASPTAYPTSGSPFSFTYATPPEPTWTVSNPSDFAQVFEDYAPLDKVVVFNILATPGITDPAVLSEAVAYCERKRAFYVMDTPSGTTDGWDANGVTQNIETRLADVPVSTNAAVYYPWLMTTDPVSGLPSTAPPSGFVAGIYAREDNARGVWKSPAGIETSLLGVAGGVQPQGILTDPQQGVLNQNALDCLRQFPGIGTVVFGARTTAGADANTAQQQWRYVAVRRMALFLEQSLYASLKWAVFQPNAEPLWQALTQQVSAFMLSLFRQGAFAGTTPTASFLVQCDSNTTTANDIANGVVNILVGFAPLEPAEFVVIQIAQLAGQAQG
jgi:uncharacterized protein